VATHIIGGCLKSDGDYRNWRYLQLWLCKHL